jgi:hypothetical protein
VHGIWVAADTENACSVVGREHRSAVLSVISVGVRPSRIVSFSRSATVRSDWRRSSAAFGAPLEGVSTRWSLFRMGKMAAAIIVLRRLLVHGLQNSQFPIKIA